LGQGEVRVLLLCHLPSLWDQEKGFLTGLSETPAFNNKVEEHTTLEQHFSEFNTLSNNLGILLKFRS